MAYFENVSLIESIDTNSIKQSVSQAATKSKNWIINKISQFRKLYKEYLKRLNKEKSEDKITVFENIMRVILNAIDRLAAIVEEKFGTKIDTSVPSSPSTNDNSNKSDNTTTSNTTSSTTKANMPDSVRDMIKNKRSTHDAAKRVLDDLDNGNDEEYNKIQDEIFELKNAKAHGRKIDEKRLKELIDFKNEYSRQFRLKRTGNFNSYRFNKHINIGNAKVRDIFIQGPSDVKRAINRKQKTGTYKGTKRRFQFDDEDDDSEQGDNSKKNTNNDESTVNGKSTFPGGFNLKQAVKDARLLKNDPEAFYDKKRIKTINKRAQAYHKGYYNALIKNLNDKNSSFYNTDPEMVKIIKGNNTNKISKQQMIDNINHGKKVEYYGGLDEKDPLIRLLYKDYDGESDQYNIPKQIPFRIKRRYNSSSRIR